MATWSADSMNDPTQWHSTSTGTSPSWATLPTVKQVQGLHVWLVKLALMTAAGTAERPLLEGYLAGDEGAGAVYGDWLEERGRMAEADQARRGLLPRSV